MRVTALLLGAALALTGCTGGASKDTPQDAPGVAPTLSASRPTTSATGTPSTTASPAPSTTASPGEDLAPLIPMSRDVDLPRPPVWGIPEGTDWRFTVRDQQGTNRLTHPNGCVLTTLQWAGTIADIPGTIPGVDDQRPTDATATQHHLDKTLRDFEPNVRQLVVNAPPKSLPIAFGAEGRQRIEFAAIDLSYIRSGDTQRLHTMLVERLMPRPGARLSAELTCPAEAFEAGRAVIDELRVLPG